MSAAVWQGAWMQSGPKTSRDEGGAGGADGQSQQPKAKKARTKPADVRALYPLGAIMRLSQKWFHQTPAHTFYTDFFVVVGHANSGAPILRQIAQTFTYYPGMEPTGGHENIGKAVGEYMPDLTKMDTVDVKTSNTARGLRTELKDETYKTNLYAVPWDGQALVAVEGHPV